MKDAIARGMEGYIFKLELKGHNITHTNNNGRYLDINKDKKLQMSTKRLK